MTNNKKPAFWKRLFPFRPGASAYFRRTSSSSQVTLPDNENGYCYPDSNWNSEYYTQPTPSPDYDTSDGNCYTMNRRRQSSYSSVSLCHSDSEKVRKSRNRNKSKKNHKEKRYESDSDMNGSPDRSRNHKKYILKTDSDFSSDSESDGHSDKKGRKKATQKVVISSVKNRRNNSKARTKYIENKKRNKRLSELSSISEDDMILSLKSSKVKKSILKDKRKKERQERDLNWTLRGKPDDKADELMLRITMNDFKNVIKKNVISAVKQTIDAKVEEEREIKRVRCISPDILTTDTEANNSKTSGDLLLPRVVRQDGHPSALHLVPTKKHCIMKRFLPYCSSSSENTANSRKNSVTAVNSGTPRPPLQREQMERRRSLREALLLQNHENQWHNGEQLLMQTSSLGDTLPRNVVNDPVEEYYSQYLENNSGYPIIDQTVSTGYHTNNEERNGLWNAKRRHSLGVFSLENQNKISQNTFQVDQANSTLHSVNPGTISPSYFTNRRESVMSIDRQLNNMIPMSRRASIQYPTGASTYLDGGPFVSASTLVPQNNAVRRASVTSNQGVPFSAVGVADYQANTDIPESLAMTSVLVQDANVPKISSDLSTVVEESVQSKEECVKNAKKSVSQVDAHLRNTRTRFVKLLKRKSGAPAVVLSYTDQKILDRYMFLRPHIQRNKTRATHTFAHVQFGGDADDDEGDDDDIDDNHSQEGVEPQPDTSGTQDGSQQTSTSLAPSKGKGKCKNKRPCPSPIPDSPDLSEIQILQQAQNLISNIRVPTKSDHERRVRDFSRYMEDEMPRIPESSWDECSFTIMNVIRGFKSAHQHGQPTISQAPAYQQNSGSQYPEQQRGYLTRQFGTVQQPNTIQQLGTFNQPSSFLPLSTYHSPSTYQQPSAYQQPSTCQQPSTLQQFGSIQQQTCSLQQSQPEPGTGLVWFLRALRPRNS